MNTGLDDSAIYFLSVSGLYLYAGTGHNGVWRRPLSDFGISSVAPQPMSAAPISIYPNPISSRATIAFTTPSPGYADVRVVNQLGVEVARVFSGELGAGEHSFVWNAAGTAAPRGMYECVVRMNGSVEDIPILVSR